MRPLFFTLLPGLALLCAIVPCRAADKWPRVISTANGTVIYVYKPDILSYTGTTVHCRSVISVMDVQEDDPVFGVAWTTATVVTDSAKKRARIESIHVDELSIPADKDPDDIRFLSAAMEVYMPRELRSYPLREIEASLAEQQQDMAYTDVDTVKKAPVTNKFGKPIIYN